MNRRNFLIKTIPIMAGITGLFLTTNPIKDAILYSPEELKKIILFSTNSHSLEKMIMMGTLLTEESPKLIIDIHKETNQNLSIDFEIKRLEEDITELSIEKIMQFSKKAPSDEELYETRDEIDRKYQKINELKESKNMDLVSFKRMIFLSSQRNFLELDESVLKELYQFDKYILFFDSLIKNEEINYSLRKLSKTLINLSPESLFISEASKISEIPIEEIVAFANIESMGRTFAVGRGGEINRFQLNPKYLWDIYKNTLSQKNSLSDYIQEKTSKETLLEDLIRDSKLNTAMAVNLMKYLKEHTNTNYEYVLAYNKGLNRALNLSAEVKEKLKHPEKISEIDKEHPIFKYYSNFLSTKKDFEKIKSSLQTLA